MNAAPQYFRWEGDAMKPLRPKQADEAYTIGQVYRLASLEERSQNSHNHFFAALHEAWVNLPEDLALQYQSAEHLRKYALIKCGYANERSIVCASRAEALRIAAFIRPMDQYAVVVASEAVVRVFTAQSQSRKAMGAKVFQESKEKVLDAVAAMVGISVEQLQKNTGRAA